MVDSLRDMPHQNVGLSDPATEVMRQLNAHNLPAPARGLALQYLRIMDRGRGRAWLDADRAAKKAPSPDALSDPHFAALGAAVKTLHCSEKVAAALSADLGVALRSGGRASSQTTSSAQKDTKNRCLSCAPMAN